MYSSRPPDTLNHKFKLLKPNNMEGGEIQCQEKSRLFRPEREACRALAAQALSCSYCLPQLHSLNISCAENCVSPPFTGANQIFTNNVRIPRDMQAVSNSALVTGYRAGWKRLRIFLHLSENVMATDSFKKECLELVNEPLGLITI